MGRPINEGPEAEEEDLKSLQRALRRARRNVVRSSPDAVRLKKILQSAIEIYEREQAERDASAAAGE